MITIALLLTGICQISLAGPRDETQKGFSGNFLIGTMISSQDLSLNDASEDDNRRITSLTQPLRDESKFVPLISGGVSYTFAESGTTIGLGDTDGAASIYLAQPLPDMGTVSLGFSFDETDVYSDPFITGTNRSVTDKESLGISLAWEEIMESGIYTSYSAEFIDIDNDAAGRRDNRLKRDGTLHNLRLGWNAYEDDIHAISGGAVFIIADLSGAAMSYDGWGVEAGYTLKGEKWDLETGISVVWLDFDGPHPEFNKKRDDREYSISSVYTYHEPFGFERFFVSVIAAYNKTDSNIHFYDASGLIGGLGLGINF